MLVRYTLTIMMPAGASASALHLCARAAGAAAAVLHAPWRLLHWQRPRRAGAPAGLPTGTVSRPGAARALPVRLAGAFRGKHATSSVT